MESDKKSASNTFSQINHKFGLLKTNNRKVFSTPLKKYTSSRQNNQLCIKLVKTDQRQGYSPDRERSKNTISRKVKPRATSDRNKNVSGGKKISGHRSSGIVEEGGNSTCSRIKRSICQQHFSETEKRRSSSSDYKFEKMEPIIPYLHLKMEGLKQLKDLLRQSDLMVKIVLKEAYFSIPMHPETQKYVKFQWKGNLYQFLCLCFVLGPAPRIFTKLLKVLMSIQPRINI